MKIAIVAVAVLFSWTSCGEKKDEKKKRDKRATPSKAVPDEGKTKIPAEGNRKMPAEANRKMPAEAPPKAPKRSAAAGHPDYPTPKAAGTAAIFSLEEPNRGPLVTKAALPSRARMKKSYYDYCEYEVHGLTCGKPRKRRGRDHFEIARRGKVELVTRFQGGKAKSIVLLRRDGAGKLTQVITMGGDRVVRWSSAYTESGTKLSRRRRSGANGFAGCGSKRIELDASGRAAAVTCLQWMGEPMRDSDGVSITRFTRDAGGFVTERKFFGPKGEPTERHDRVHKQKIVRDKAGRPTENLAFDRDGKPVISEADDGCHRQKTEYDRNGREVAQRCLDANGKPVAGDSNVAVWKYNNDANGCQVSASNHGVRDEPILSTHGVHAVVWTLGKHCRTLGERCTDTAGKPTPCGPRQSAEYRYKLDKKGNRISVRHFDAAGKPGQHYAHRAFELRYSYDDRGRQIGHACFDVNGAAQRCSGSGYHRSARTLDDAGREVAKRFFGTKGEPATNVGAALRKSTYDNYDHVHEVVGLDINGEPFSTRGMFKQRHLYDAGHRLFGILLFDTKGKPARYRACYVGMTCPVKPWQALRIVRSERGHVLQNQYFNHDKKLIATIDCAKKPCWK